MVTRSPRDVWGKHCESAFVELGVQPAHGRKPCFHHLELEMALIVSVDDFAVAGQKTQSSQRVGSYIHE